MDWKHIKPFKITRRHLSKYNNLDTSCLGLYGFQIKGQGDVLAYENKAVAEKALKYFRTMWK